MKRGIEYTSFEVPGANTPLMPAPKLNGDLSFCAPKSVGVEAKVATGNKSFIRIEVGDTFKIDSKVMPGFTGRVTGFECIAEPDGHIIPDIAVIEPLDQSGGRQERFMVDTLAVGGNLFTKVSRVVKVENDSAKNIV